MEARIRIYQYHEQNHDRRHAGLRIRLWRHSASAGFLGHHAQCIANCAGCWKHYDAYGDCEPPAWKIHSRIRISVWTEHVDPAEFRVQRNSDKLHS